MDFCSGHSSCCRKLFRLRYGLHNGFGILHVHTNKKCLQEKMLQLESYDVTYLVSFNLNIVFSCFNYLLSSD